MPGRDEIKRAFEASIRLARGDATGYRLLDNTIDGFWRSFSAIILIAPLFLIADRAELAISVNVGADGRETGPDYYAGRLVLLAIGWVAYPLAMVGLARLLALGHRYAPYIVAYNWTSVLIAVVIVPPGLLFLLGVIEAEWAVVLNLAATLWALYFRYWVARTALMTTISTAIGLVVFDVLLTIAISLGADAVGL